MPIAPVNKVLCVQRSDGSTTSTQDPYQGIATCGATTTQGKPIETQAKTDR